MREEIHEEEWKKIMQFCYTTPKDNGKVKFSP